MIAVAPGIGATIYGHLPRDVTAEVVSAADFVCLHTLADATDITTAAQVRRMGCARVWLATPANYLVRTMDRHGEGAAIVEAKRAARIALDAGCEVFEFNGEGSSDGKAPGDWIPADAAEASRLARLAAEAIEAARDVLGTRCAVAWTSHDMPGFKLPWRAILERVDLHAPQHYPAEAGRQVPQRELAARIARSQGRWEELAHRGEIPADAAPYGARWSPYLQGWGHTPGALVWGLCEAATARLWAYPGSWSAAAVPALRAARALRSVAGYGPDAVERWQAAHGLDADGAVGPRTLAALVAA